MLDPPKQGNPRLGRRSSQDAIFMRQAIEEAGLAGRSGDVPVGALVVCDGKVVARAHNQREQDQDPTAHAEVIALRRAAKTMGRWNLSDCDLYVTLEPCVMCAGAVLAARIRRLVFGALDAKAGAVRSRYAILEDPRMNHQTAVVGPLLAEEAGRLLTDFFARLRKK